MLYINEGRVYQYEGPIDASLIFEKLITESDTLEPISDSIESFANAQTKKPETQAAESWLELTWN